MCGVLAEPSHQGAYSVHDPIILLMLVYELFKYFCQSSFYTDKEDNFVSNNSDKSNISKVDSHIENRFTVTMTRPTIIV